MDKCEWCNTKLYDQQYYGNADFDMKEDISEGDWTYLSMLWNSKTNKMD